MKQILLSIICLCCLSAQAQISFKKVYGDPTNGEYGQAVVQGPDSGYYVAGAHVLNGTQITGEGQLLHTDKYGNEIWTKYYNMFGSDDLSFDNIQWTSDGNLIVTGVVVLDSVDYEVYLTKIDTAGNVLWYGNYGGIYRQRGLQVKETADHGFVIGGWNESLGSAISNFYIVRVDTNGDLLWTKDYPNGMQQYGNAIDQTTDGGFAMVGSIQLPVMPGTTIYIIKTDASGDTAWTRKLDSLNFGAAYDVKAIANNHIVVTGYTNAGGCSQPLLLEMDGAGNIVWKEIYTDGPCGWSYSVCKTADGGYALFGMDGIVDHYLIKTDAYGDTEWFRKFHTSTTDYGYGVSQTSDGGYIMTGITTNTNVADLILIKVDGDGELLSVAGKELAGGISIYPNPTSDLLHISNQGGAEILSIELYDATGKQVHRSTEAKSISTSQLSKGLYLLKIRTEQGELHQKILLQ